MTNFITAQKILVTGANGFIGSHLCRRLLQENSEVHGFSRSPEASPKAGFRWWQGDAADFARMREIVSSVKPAYIFHLASEVIGARSLEAVLPTFRSNLASTVNLLTLAAEFGCRRIVLAGSLEEPDGAEMAPCSPYAAAKWASSSYARMFHLLYQLPVVMARIFMVYGPEQRDLRKLIPYVTLSLLRGEAPQLSSGLRPVDWIYIDDVVDGLLAAASVPGVEGGTVELGSGHLVTIRIVVEKLAALINSSAQPVFGAQPDRPMERIRAAQASLTHEQIGWRSRTSLDEGLRATIDWYQSTLGNLSVLAKASEPGDSHFSRVHPMKLEKPCR
jgi:UDP-glucose 4-epimerase